MSGPKVVRIVTREELISICKGQLARLDAALATWKQSCIRKDLAGDDEIAASYRRRDEIADLLAADRFADLQKAVPIEIAFLKTDLKRRQDKAAETAARARKTARREREAASALLAALEVRGADIPAIVKADLRKAADGRGEVATAMAAGFALFTTPFPEAREDLKALAAKLKGEESDRSLAGWMARQPASPDDGPLAHIELRLAELEGLLDTAQVADAERRLTLVRAGPDETRRRLLLDSLALDLSKAVVEARAVAAQRAALEEALAELAGLDVNKAEMFAGLPAVSTASEIADRLEAVEAVLAAARSALAAEARRKAVLKSLASLGYEVGSELETSWVESGQVVLRRAAQRGYGVELSGPASADRLQMRVVAFGSGPADPARDRDAETLWCNTVEQLREDLARAGARLEIERALPVGAAAVKRVQLAGVAEVAAERIAPKAGRALE